MVRSRLLELAHARGELAPSAPIHSVKAGAAAPETRSHLNSELSRPRPKGWLGFRAGRSRMNYAAEMVVRRSSYGR